MSDLPLIPISTVTDPTYNAPEGPKRTDKLDKDAFLQLLVAQLKYQNPLSPSDPNQFMAQTAQFTMVEKLEELAQGNNWVVTMTESQTATSMIGRQITWIGADGTTQTGVPTAATFGSDGAVLVVGDERVPLDRVSGVKAATTPAPAATDAATTDTTPPATDPAEDTAPTDGTEPTESTDSTETPAQEA